MKSKLETLTAKEIEQITKKSLKNKKVPLVVSKPAKISLDEELNARIKVLSTAQGIPADAFIKNLLKEDVDRLWRVYRMMAI